MAKTSQAAVSAASALSPEQLARVEEWTREPLTDDGTDLLKPGTATRRAIDAALAEIEQGHYVPSVEWRQRYSLMLGLERVLSVDEPKLADGTVLSAHQVDVLSGTLTALVAEEELRNGNAPASPIGAAEAGNGHLDDGDIAEEAFVEVDELDEDGDEE